MELNEYIDVSQMKILLDALPHPAMIINNKRKVIAANSAAIEVGAEVGDYCWKEFGKCAFLSAEHLRICRTNPDAEGISCTFCLADECLKNESKQNDPNVKAFDRQLDTYWVALSKETYLHYAIDVTDQVKTERALEASEERLLTAMEANNNGLWDWDIKNQSFFFKVADKALFGLPPHETTISVEAFIKHIHPKDQALFEQALADHLSGATPKFSVEYRFLGKDEKITWILSRGKIVSFDASGKPQRMVGTHTDITERKRTEESLEWEYRIHKELASLGNALIESNLTIENITQIVLKSAKTLTGSKHGYASEIDPSTGDNVIYTHTLMMGNDCQVNGPDQRIRFPASKKGKYPKLWGHALNSGEPFFSNSPQSHEKYAGIPQGHIPIDRFLSMPVKYSREVIGQIALANPANDYNERHLEAIQRLADLYALAIHRQRAMEERKQMEIEAIRTSQLATLGELSAGVAHEINNPITGVINYAQMLLNKADQGSNQEDLAKRIIYEGNRVASIVSKLLSFSRKEEGATTFIDVHNLIDVPLSLIKNKLASDGIHVQVNIEENIPQVRCNSQQIEQVLLNLLSNSQYSLNKKYPKNCADKKIEVNVGLNKRNQQSLVTFEVKDYGIGIPENILPNIFSAFFTTKEVGMGTGLGLSIIERIISVHNGQIKVESEEGKFASFVIEIPLFVQ